MAKKQYHLPTQKVKTLLDKHQTELRTLTQHPKQSEYHKRMSKAYYLCEVEMFLHTFGIEKEMGYALKLLGYFESKVFYETLHKLMGGVEHVYML